MAPLGFSHLRDAGSGVHPAPSRGGGDSDSLHPLPLLLHHAGSGGLGALKIEVLLPKGYVHA